MASSGTLGEGLEKMRREGRLGEGAPLETLPEAAEKPGKAKRVKNPLKESEAEFQKRVIDLAHVAGWKVAHFRPAWAGERMITPVAGDGAGFPDLILTKPGHQIAAELKVEPNKPTDEQLDWLVHFALAGVPAYVWYPRDWAFIEKLLRTV